MSKARGLADLGNAYSDGALSNRNVLINGNFSVYQRSSGPVTGSGYTTVDRWDFPNSGQTTEVVANDRVSRVDKMLKVTAASSGYGIIRQKVENVKTLSDETVTLSFWAKSANASTMRLEIQQAFGSGGSTAVTAVNNATYWSIPNTGWNFYTATVNIPSVSGKTIGSGNMLSVVVGPNSGTANNIVYYSEVQLEVGDTATPFEHRSYGDELQRCQRYFERLNGDGAYGPYAGFGTGYSNGATGPIVVTMRTSKRANPSFSTSGSFRILSGSGVSTFAFASDVYIDKSGTGYININSLSPTTGTGYGLVLTANNDANARFDFDAEL